MTALVLAELRKVRTTRLWIVLLGVAMAVAAVGAIALLAIAGTAQGAQAGLHEIRTVADVRTVVASGNIAATFALILGATMSTAEYRYGTAGITYLATPRRASVVTAKMVSAIPIGAAFGLLGGLVPLLAVVVSFAARGKTLPFDGSVPTQVLELGLQAVFGAVIGVAIGAVIRSQLAAIISLLAWAFVVEPIVQGLLPAWIKWFPFAGAASAFGSGQQADLLPRPQAALLMAVYVVAAWAAAVWVERRRDV